MQKADAIRHKRNRENQRKCWQLLRTIIHGNKTSGGISHVLIPLPPDINTPKEQTPPQRIQTKQDMDNVLIDRNIDHFAQAHGTPFTISPLLDLFGTDGCTEAALSVLDGNIPTTVPHYSKLILQEILFSQTANTKTYNGQTLKPSTQPTKESIRFDHGGRRL
jgi:hypothetical protein